jgi:hypothetical protein
MNNPGPTESLARVEDPAFFSFGEALVGYHFDQHTRSCENGLKFDEAGFRYFALSRGEDSPFWKWAKALRVVLEFEVGEELGGCCWALLEF